MPGGTAVAVAAPAAPPSATGADLRGWSALPLVGVAQAPAGSWLFVTSGSQAWLSGTPVAAGRFVSIAAEYIRHWPFADGALGGVVIDGDAIAATVDHAALERLLIEASRAAGHQGNVLLVCSHRLWPRRLRAWREYGRHTADTWRRAATGLGLEVTTAAGVQLDGARVTGLVVADDAGSDADRTRLARGADRLAVRVAGRGSRPLGVLAAIVADVSGRCGVPFELERVGVRKIGKTAVFLASADGRRVVLRVPRSPIALARAARNYATLESLQASALPPAMTALVPAPLARAEHAGYAYFVETCLGGRSGPSPAAAQRTGGWDTAAVEFIAALHQATGEPTVIDDREVERLVREPFSRVLRACGSGRAAAAVTAIAADCERALAGTRLPLVQVHGDFSSTNCLFDAAGRLTAVVDWEVSVPRGLPLLDVLQLMPVPGELGSHPRWQRFDAWLALSERPEAVLNDPVMGDYARALSVPAGTIAALVTMQWATHVAERVDARSDDERWMRQRVWQPLESLMRSRS